MKRIMGLRVVVSVVVACGVLLGAESSAWAAEEHVTTAWEALVASDPEAAARLSPLARSICTRITPEDLQRLQAGAHTSEVWLIDGRRLDTFLAEVMGVGSFAVPFYTIDAGGGISDGGVFRVDGSIGQPDAGTVASAIPDVAVYGGFRDPLGNHIFSDGFESGDTGQWSATVPP